MIQKSKEGGIEISPAILATLIITLAIISVFVLYLTFVVNQWPLQSNVILADLVYLGLLAGYISIFTGLYRAKWLVIAVAALGIVSAVTILWLYWAFSNFNTSL